MKDLQTNHGQDLGDLGGDARDATLDLDESRIEAPPLSLLLQSPGRPPRSVRLAAAQAVEVGGAHDCDVVIDDATVSGRHARFEGRGAWIDVVDLGSRNGVRLGEVRVGRAALPLGAIVTLGRTTARVVLAARTEERPSLLAGVVGSSRPMRELAAQVRRLAAHSLPVLLRGESGTGKDLVARALHVESRRHRRPFVVLNAATLSRELCESELFGHERGAFTGALRDRRGAFREADGGTLFLDEVAALGLDVQAKLLRVVEEGFVRPLGAERASRVEVRLVAATCEPLEQMVASRRFRHDLYERLAVCVLRVPSLAERSGDIEELARHLLEVSDFAAHTLSREALERLRAHRWPGNVRELRNVLVQAALRSEGAIEAHHVGAVLAERGVQPRRLRPDEARVLYESCGRNTSAAARAAQLPRSTMRDLLRDAEVRTDRGP